VLPAGECYALQVIIGQGQGRGGNWWCALFPPLPGGHGHRSREYAAGNLDADPVSIMIEYEPDRAPVRMRLAVLEPITRLSRRPPWHRAARS